MNNKRYINENKKYWDELTPLHAKSKFYDLNSFKSGKLSLMDLEIKEVGSVKNKSLLHLQCHFGMDTLSWARLGANVTGVDLSDKSAELARKLAKELNLEAKFIASDIYDLPNNLHEEFDIVYTSGGVLSWLPDIVNWAKVVNRFVKKGGFFYLRDDHPLALIFDENFKVAKNYFHEENPTIEQPNGSYATPEKVINLHYDWHHGLSDIINAIVDTGLKIKFIHEFPFLGWARFPNHMKKDEDGWYRFKDTKIKIPLMFSLMVYK